jgi:hypothetical protein
VTGDELVPTRRSSRTGLATPSPPPVSTGSRTPVSATRWSRRRGVLSAFAAFAVVGFAAAYIGPTGVAISQANAEDTAPVSLYASSAEDVQTRVVAEGVEAAAPAALDRGGYSVYVKPPPPPPPPPPTLPTGGSSTAWRPPFVSPDPGSAQAIAYQMVLARGWGDDQFACLVSLWNKESGWRVNAYNPSSGAYGIPQALPGSKMGSAGADWETNAATQITWGLGYISGRYGTPCGAWDHSVRTGWY